MICCARSSENATPRRRHLVNLRCSGPKKYVILHLDQNISCILCRAWAALPHREATKQANSALVVADELRMGAAYPCQATDGFPKEQHGAARTSDMVRPSTPFAFTAVSAEIGSQFRRTWK